MDLRPPPRNETPPRRSGVGIFLLLQVLTLGALAGLFLLRGDSESVGDADEVGRLRRVASQLKAGGALDEAAAVYEQLAGDFQLEATLRAQLAYSAGTTAMERGQFERALRWLYLAEDLDGDGLGAEVGKKIVHCLERLGRVHAAKAALDARTQVAADPVKRAASDPVVAKIGSSEVHASDIQRSLDDLPPQLQKEFEGQKGRAAFVRKYVADELLWRKAQKLEMDKAPDVQRRLSLLYKQVVVDEFVRRELVDKIQVDEADLRTFHEANRERYDQKEPPKEKPFSEVRTAVERDYRMMKLQAGYQELIASELATEEVTLMPEKLQGP